MLSANAVSTEHRSAATTRAPPVNVNWQKPNMKLARKVVIQGMEEVRKEARVHAAGLCDKAEDAAGLLAEGPTTVAASPLVAAVVASLRVSASSVISAKSQMSSWPPSAPDAR
jgi:hypothetical protein